MCGGWESILRRPEACYNAQQLLPCPKDREYSSSRTSLLLEERLLFSDKLKSEDLLLKNQIKSKSHRSIDSSIVLFGRRRSEVIFLVFFFLGGGVGGWGRGEISSIIVPAAISISVSILKEL